MYQTYQLFTHEFKSKWKSLYENKKINEPKNVFIPSQYLFPT